MELIGSVNNELGLVLTVEELNTLAVALGMTNYSARRNHSESRPDKYKNHVLSQEEERNLFYTLGDILEDIEVM